MKHKVFILMTVAILCLVGWTTQAQTRAPTSTTWEYKIIRMPGWDKDGEAKLNQLEVQGWQFVSYKTLSLMDQRARTRRGTWICLS